jgi:hypothetical protein
MVLMLKPNVGLMVVISSPLIRLTIVVFPALSSPLQQTSKVVSCCCQLNACSSMPGACPSAAYTMRRRISFSFCLTFLMMVSRPMVQEKTPAVIAREEVSTAVQVAG